VNWLRGEPKPKRKRVRKQSPPSTPEASAEEPETKKPEAEEQEAEEQEEA
jgi:hypothetical protein